MAGLRLPWHSKRVTKQVKSDLCWLHKLLGLNMGRGYYSYEHFRHAPEHRTDASKSGKFAGGGYVSRCGSNASSVPYSRTTIFEGAPHGYRERISEMLDNRFSASSWRTIKAAMSHWERACERH
eukprot:4329053-Prymnesium_polylepis.1